MLRNTILVLSCLALLLPSCNDSKSDAPAKSKSPDASKAPKSEKPTTPAPAAAKPAATPAKSAATGGPNPVVVMDTSLGSITIELDAAKAPITVANFLKYVDDGFYAGTVFHRVIKTFMIQGGGFEPGMKEKETRAKIQNEAKNGLKNKRGTIAMARTNAPHSAGAQFFINVVDNAMLDHPRGTGWGYCVFGKVIDGMDAVDKIKDVKVGNKGRFGNVPVEDVMINSAKRK